MSEGKMTAELRSTTRRMDAVKEMRRLIASLQHSIADWQHEHVPSAGKLAELQSIAGKMAESQLMAEQAADDDWLRWWNGEKASGTHPVHRGDGRSVLGRRWGRSMNPNLDLTKIGGSDVAAIMGVSPWATSWDVWTRIVKGKDDFEANEQMRLGTYLESAIFAGWLRETGDDGRWTPGTSRVINDRWRVTPDFLCESRPILAEVKNTSMMSEWNTIPTHYNLQVQWYLHHLEIPEAVMVVCHGGSKIRSYPVERRIDKGQELVEAAIKFWRDHVETGKPPEVDHSATCRSYLEEQTPPSETKDVRPATDDECLWMLQIATADQEIKEWDRIKKTAQNLLLQSIGEGYGVEGPIGKMLAIYRNGSTRMSYKDAWEEAKQQLPPVTQEFLLQKHSRETAGGRTMRFYPVKS